MKITVPRQDLLNAVNKAKAIVSSKSALPILSHILFDASESSVRLSATDLKVSIECTTDCTVEKPGSLTVSSRRLSDIITELPDTDITIELTDSNIVVLKCGKTETRLYSMAPEEFPPIRAFDGIEPLILPQKMLKNIFQKTSFAICTDQARYNLTGLLIEIADGKLTAVATDGRRMSLYIEKEGIAEGIEVKVIIPGKMINELERLLDGDDDVKIHIDENHASFTFGSTRLVTQLIEGTFPNYELVVPKKHDKEATLSTEQFTEAIRRTRTMTNEKFNSVRFQLSEGNLTLKVSTPEVGEFQEDMPMEYAGEALEIAFNPDFVLDVLRQINSDSACLVVKDPMSPGIIKPLTDSAEDNYVNVVMPIRI